MKDPKVLTSGEVLAAMEREMRRMTEEMKSPGWGKRRVFPFHESRRPGHNPVVVDAWHGSGRIFRKFEQIHARIPNDYFGGGIAYFTDDHGVAKTYAKSMAKSQGTKTPFIYHTRLTMRNVFDVDGEFTGPELLHLLPDNEKEYEQFARGAGLLRLGVDRYQVLSDLKNGNVKLNGKQVFFGLSNGGINTARAREHLIRKGFDGIRYNGGENMNMAVRHNVYIPYNANSIKINKITTLTKKSA